MRHTAVGNANEPKNTEEATVEKPPIFSLVVQDLKTFHLKKFSKSNSFPPTSFNLKIVHFISSQLSFVKRAEKCCQVLRPFRSGLYKLSPHNSSWHIASIKKSIYSQLYYMGLYLRITVCV
jgi:hypothetical protein